MPANKNAMTRYKILDDLLSNRYRHYSLDDLTEEVSERLAEVDPSTDGVCRRTIEKDLRYLEYESPFMVELERYSVSTYDHERGGSVSKRCVRYADSSFSIFKKELSDDEKYLLREALSILGQLDGLPDLEGLESLRQGLRVPEEQPKILSFGKNPLANSKLLGQLFTAISHRVVVSLSYHTFSAPDDVRSIELSPYLLREYNRRWFVFGAVADGTMLCFALDRIDRLELLTSETYRDCEVDMSDYFSEVIGVTVDRDSPLREILFWVSDQSMDYVSTKPLHQSQRQVTVAEEESLRVGWPSLAGGRFFRITCRENYELFRELTSFGEHLIVLSPSEVRQKIKKRIESMTFCYGESEVRR